MLLLKLDMLDANVATFTGDVIWIQNWGSRSLVLKL